MYICIYVYNCLRLCQPRIPQLPARSNPAALYCRKGFGGAMGVFFFQGFLFHMDLGILKIPRSIGGVRSPGYGTQTKLIHHNKGFMGGCSSIFAYLFWGAGNEIMSEHSLYFGTCWLNDPQSYHFLWEPFAGKFAANISLSNKTPLFDAQFQLLLVTGYSRSC